MKILLLGTVYFILIGNSCGQFGNIPLDMFSSLDGLYDKIGIIENSFGASLTKKLIELATEIVAGTFTPSSIIDFLRNLTTEDKENVANGLITLVQEFEKYMSAPGTREHIQMFLTLAPMLLGNLGQVLGSGSEPKTTSLKDKAEPLELTHKKVGGADVDEHMEKVRAMLENLAGGARATDDLDQVLADLLNAAGIDGADAMKLAGLAPQGRAKQSQKVKDEPSDSKKDQEKVVGNTVQGESKKDTKKDGIKKGTAANVNKQESESEKDEL